MSSFPSSLSRIPRYPSALVRPRLAELLDGEDPAILLTGPAGSGKTVLAAQLAGAVDRCGWCRVTAAFGRAADILGIAASSLGATAACDGGPVELAGELLDLLETSSALVVIDDYQFADGEDCDPFLAEAVPLVPPGSKLVVCSLTRPAGLIGRVSAGAMRILDAERLAFTAEEAEALFVSWGRSADRGRRAYASLGGWPVGLASLAESGDALEGQSLDHAVRRTLVSDDGGDDRETIEALAVLPYVSRQVAQDVGLDPDAVERVAARSSLVVEAAGQWRAHQVLRDVFVADVGADRARDLRRHAAASLANVDPPVAIDLFLEADDPDAAAEVLGDHLSEIGVQRALRWLYRLPPELRRAFPPVLAAGKATVDIDAAIASAELRVERAPDETARREALFALGSAHAHDGALAAAAAALEQATAPGGPEGLRAKANAWLGVVRWWAGDLAGARAALASAGDEAIATWALAETALAEGANEEAETAARVGANRARDGEGELSEAPFRAVLARVALLGGDRAVGRGLARSAYQLGAEQDGFDLGAAAPVHAWVLVDDGDLEGATAVADVLERRMARHDAFAKVHVALIRLAIARRAGAVTDVDRAQRRLSQLRQLGFAPLEAQARALVTALAGTGEARLEVLLLGPALSKVGDREVPTSAWKSRKALEVLWYLALAGKAGAQREGVIEAVWPERDPVKGRMLLRAALAEIRRRLEPGRPAGEPSRYLHASGDRVLLDAACDVTEARQLARDGDAVQALALFRGELLEEQPYLEWAFEERRATTALRLELAERVGEDGGAPSADRVAALELVIAAEPWRESLYDLVAAIHRDTGDEAAARSAERRRDEPFS